MSIIDIGVNGLRQKLAWLHQAFDGGRVHVNDAVDIVFRGSPVPTVERRGDVLVMSWPEGAYVDGPGMLNVTVNRIEAYRDSARIFLDYSPDIDIVDRMG
jgi:hypothetical protein